jgi:hypothetical protein
LSFLILAASGAASTISPPSNLGELARISRSVVLAQAGESWGEMSGRLPNTVTRFEVIRQVAGEKVGTRFEVQRLGGSVGETGLAVNGAPEFEPGARYLLFLDRAEGGRFRPRMLSYGILRESGGASGGILRPLPEAAKLQVIERPGVEPVGTYRTDDLLRTLGATATGAPWSRQAAGEEPAAAVAVEPEEKARAEAPEAETSSETFEAFVGAPLHTKPAVCSFLTSQDGLPVRWFDFESGTAASVWHTTPGQVGISDGGVAAVQEGATVWTNHPDSIIRLNYAGSRASTISCADGTAPERHVNEVTFNDPCNELPDLAACGGTLPPGWSSVCCGEVAVGGVFYNTSSVRAHDGENWRPVDSPFVVVNNGASCLGETDFKEMMTHQLGHGLGFWHHNDTNATMYGELGVHAPRGAAITDTDKKCAAYAYHTFRDVPFSSPLWKFIEAIENASVTGGCGGGNFCPTGGVTREQMAVFLLVAKEGKTYTPPACSTPIFNDVPCSSPFAAWINELYSRGVVAGCGNGNYCPKNPVTREQVAVFLIATLEGTAFTPPACTTPSFTDVPCSSPFAPWIKELVDRGITGGCQPGQYCPKSVITRGQMSVFLTATYSLPFPNYP